MINFYGVTRQGAYHIKNGTVCQDAHQFIRVNDDIGIAAVADGLGSEIHSDTAAITAVNNAALCCSIRIKNGMPMTSDDDYINLIKEAFNTAFAEILKIVARNNDDMYQYDTTLALAILVKDKLYYGNVGDSGIVALYRDGSYGAVTVQQRDENGCVFPLSAGRNMWTFGCKENVSAVLLATDGMLDIVFPYLLRNETPSIYVSMAEYLMNDINLGFKEMSEEAVQCKMESFVDGIPGTTVYDDKTIVYMGNPDFPPSRQPDEYYKVPDFEKLKKKYDEEFQKQAYPHMYGDKEKTDVSEPDKEKKRTGLWQRIKALIKNIF